MPGCFRIARWLGPDYSLRCVLFHHVAASETAFTKGLGISVTPESFESALKFFTRHYTPVRLQDVLDEPDGRRLPPQPVLVTFDDDYASIREVAAPLCKKHGVPAVCLVNAAYLDNRRLALDNLVCYATNIVGLGGVNAVANVSSPPQRGEFRSMAEVFSNFLPALSPSAREAFRKRLMVLLGTGEAELSAEAQMYLTSAQLRELADFDFEIGNHTYSHVHCRSLTREDFKEEIDRNKIELEALTGRAVRAFSVPYGCSEDLTAELVVHLRHTGHEAAFLVESLPNGRGADHFGFNRVSIRSQEDAGFFSEVEILPRFRAVRSRLFNKPSLESGQSGSPLAPAN
jgi:peptidoglycan/xylan/chitin deacetylase (PgdA/CDA1 family)